YGREPDAPFLSDGGREKRKNQGNRKRQHGDTKAPPAGTVSAAPQARNRVWHDGFYRRRVQFTPSGVRRRNRNRGVSARRLSWLDFNRGRVVFALQPRNSFFHSGTRVVSKISPRIAS